MVSVVELMESCEPLPAGLPLGSRKYFFQLALLQNLNNILIDLPGLLVGEFVNREGSHDGLGTVTRFRVANIDQESIKIRQLRSAF